MSDQDENFDPDPETTCTVCSAEFLDHEDLEVHISQMHAEQSTLQPCHFCSSTFSSLEKYSYHLRDEHVTNLKSCRHCKKVFTGFEALRKHEIKHKTNGSKTLFSCSQCRAVFENTFNLEQHEIKKHNNDSDGVILHGVFPILSSVLNIKADIFLQSMGMNTVYICVCCRMTTSDVHEYIKHLKGNACKSMVCDKCSNVYRDLRCIKRHLAVHKECHNYVSEKDKKKPCPKCKAEVETLHLTSHMLTCNPLLCRMCNVRFTTVDELTSHQAKEHPLAVSLKNCQFCRKEVVGTIALVKHIDRAHKGEFHLYKYACVYCENMYFKHPKNLFFHFLSKHRDLEPYWCKICDKKFRVRKRFTIHIKLEHKSQGFVEFDERYHVFFTDKKSEKPFQPTSLLVNKAYDNQDLGSQTETELQQTDKDTDIETSNKAKLGKKPIKLRHKEQKKGNKKKNCSLDSDLPSVTETEGNVTETDMKKLKARKTRKRKSKFEIPKKSVMVDNGEKFTEVEMLEESDQSDDEPLNKVQKRVRTSRRSQAASWNKKRIVKTDKTTLSRNKFTCKICKKYCYTYQNYHHHISLHFKKGSKKCIKCSKEFNSKAALDRHVSEKHTTSKLTETLQSLLERRKHGGSSVHPQLTPHEKFLKSIKRVRSDPAETSAKITEVTKDLSVQNFIENFTPDGNSKKINVEIDCIVTMKPLKNAIKRPPAIKLTKFRPKPANSNVRLSMPVRYKQSTGEPVKVSIKAIYPSITSVNSHANHDENYEDDNCNNYQDYDHIDNSDKIDTVPEVAEEVMLEGTEEPRNVQQVQREIVLPNLAQGYDQIRIAHLQPKAPYYKIVKVGDVIKDKSKPEEEPSDKTTEDIQLPSGTKLVNVNPLAHLLGDTPIEEVVGKPSKKYYKPRTSNFEKAIAKALLNLDKPGKPRIRSTKKSKKSVEVEQ